MFGWARTMTKTDIRPLKLPPEQPAAAARRTASCPLHPARPWSRRDQAPSRADTPAAMDLGGVCRPVQVAESRKAAFLGRFFRTGQPW